MAIVDTPLAGKADAESLLLYRKITETDPVSLPVLPGGLPRSHQRRAGKLQMADALQLSEAAFGPAPGCSSSAIFCSRCRAT